MKIRPPSPGSAAPGFDPTQQRPCVLCGLVTDPMARRRLAEPQDSRDRLALRYGLSRAYVRGLPDPSFMCEQHFEPDRLSPTRQLHPAEFVPRTTPEPLDDEEKEEQA